MELADAKKTRTASRRWLSRATNSLQKIVDMSKLPEDNRQIDKVDIEEALQEFDCRLANFESSQRIVEQQIPEEEIELDINEVGDYLDRNVSTRREATKVLMKLFPPQVDTGTDIQIGRSSNSSVKLPKLDLPRFSGQVTSWPSFWEQYQVAVDSTDLETVTKFAYLKSLLYGEAARCIEGLTLTASHYAIACEILEKRFGRKEQIIVAHIQGLLSMNIESKVQGNKTETLRALQDELLTHIRSLEALEIKGDKYGVFLTPIILSKLPQDVRMEWARESAEKESDLEFLLSFIAKEIDRRDRSAVFQRNSEPSISKEKTRPYRTPTATSLQTASAQPKDTACGFCFKRHKSWRCVKILRTDVSERERLIRNAGLCYLCLNKHHRAAECDFRCHHCGGRHNNLCCREKAQKGKMNPNVQDISNVSSNAHRDLTPQVDQGSYFHSAGQHVDNNIALRSDNVGLACTQNVISSSQVVLQTAKVLVHGAKGVIPATILFDSGSDTSYVSSSLVSKSGLRWVGSQSSSYATFGGQRSRCSKRDVFEMYVSRGVSSPLSDKHCFNAVEIPVICAPLSRPKVPLNVLSSLRCLDLADSHDAENQPLTVDILVGLDYYWQFMRGNVIRLAEGPVLHESVFGFVLSGAYHDKFTCAQSSSCQLLNLRDISETLIKNFWHLEGIGIDDKIVSDDHVLSNFSKGVSYANNRYEVGLLWKENRPELQENLAQAKSRLRSLDRKLDKDNSLKACYNGVLCEMETMGIIEEVSENQLVSPYPTFYLPHRPVVKESSESTKVRPVFDASATGWNGVALNDCLDIGPALTPNVVDVVLRFRRWKVALAADITKAFLQLGLREEDRDVHRFLWNKDGNMRIMRFLRVTFGVNCSPFLLNATLRHHLSQYDESRVVTELRDNLYVDDWLSGADTEEEAGSLFTQAKKIMADASMCLAKWTSNSDAITDFIHEQGGGIMKETGHRKVLGVRWLPEDDAFTFDGVPITNEIVVTKRVMLSFIARLFDPIGFIAPVIMTAKIMFQELWCAGVDWDDDVPSEIQDDFNAWINGLQVLKDLRIPRAYFDVGWVSVNDMELHIFGDASERGYGTCAYLRLKTGSATFTTSLITARARVAPLKKVSLPRLELIASLLSARLLVYVRKALKLPHEMKYYCWTDSTISLGWIKGDPLRWKQFIANRVREIQELTDPASWFHCPGKDNPADLLTRGLASGQLLQSNLWWKGPEWLGQPTYFTGECSVDNSKDVSDLGSEELRPVLLSAREIEQRFEVDRWGSFMKAVRVVAWVLRFIHNTRHSSESLKSEHLSHRELSASRLCLFKLVQGKAFSSELADFKSGKRVQRGSPLFKLNPMIGEDGLLRIKGRLQYSNLSWDEKHPIILPKGHLSLLLVRFQHLYLHHAGVDSMLTSLRSTYWILGLRRMAKEVKRTCVSCRRLDSNPCDQIGGPLPAARVQESPPFSVTGLDFAGPLFCIDQPGQKFYILLFTCGVVRAVHLELTDSMSMEDTIFAFRRFVARRGVPAIVYSDNARTFVGASEEIKKIFGPLAPKWRFIAPRAPWWGGWWERLVRSVKSALKKSIGRRCMSRAALETTLLEIEACINSRPITFVGDDVENINPLTPAHFLLGKIAGSQVNVVEPTRMPVTAQDLRSHQAISIERLNLFWDRWSKDYLRNLPTMVRGSSSRGNLKTGSVVLIREDNIPRLKWRMGIVTELLPGKDGVVRCVRLRTSSGIVLRPVQRLHELEVIDESTSDVTFQESLPNDTFVLREENKGCMETRSGRIVKPLCKMNL